MVALAVHPAGESHLLPGIGNAQGAAAAGPVGMHHQSFFGAAPARNEWVRGPRPPDRPAPKKPAAKGTENRAMSSRRGPRAPAGGAGRRRPVRGLEAGPSGF
ncbi:MAG: hypothetical protein BroJett029_35110 [Alphaproteobacteria bacterium]|nr:MAG: hypothetical protein BroJett029_35110 [Alphaproteobacteria bacterium]